jgi:predicted transcriptional regulator YdeE
MESLSLSILKLTNLKIMETHNLIYDITVFGFQVKAFPEGIPETFTMLMKMIPSGDQRSYYGISMFSEEGSILYYACAEETFSNESSQYNCEILKIEKGKYLVTRLKDWKTKTSSIKDIFHNMMRDERTDRSKPCIEWYKTMDEMLCMVKVDETKV